LPILDDLLEANATWEEFSAAATEELRQKGWSRSVAASTGLLQQCVPPDAVRAWAQRRADCVAARDGLELWVTAVDDKAIEVALWWRPTWASDGGRVSSSIVVGGHRDDSTIQDRRAFAPEFTLKTGEVQTIGFFRTSGADFKLTVVVNDIHSAAIEVPWIDKEPDWSVIAAAPVRGVRVTFNDLNLAACDACSSDSGARFNISAIARGKSDTHRETRRNAGDVSRQMLRLPVTKSSGRYSIDKTMLIEIRPRDRKVVIKGTIHATTEHYSTTPPTPFEITLDRVNDRWVVPRNREVRNLTGEADGRVRWRGVLEYSVEYLRF
jgi:hypothetical protein